MPNGQPTTPAERAAALVALKAAVADATDFLADMEIPANVDDRMAGQQDDLNSLATRVAKLEAQHE